MNQQFSSSDTNFIADPLLSLVILFDYLYFFVFLCLGIYFFFHLL